MTLLNTYADCELLGPTGIVPHAKVRSPPTTPRSDDTRLLVFFGPLGPLGPLGPFGSLSAEFHPIRLEGEVDAALAMAYEKSEQPGSLGSVGVDAVLVH